MGRSKIKSIVERFWSKVDQSAGPDACWPWLAPPIADRYGCFWIPNVEAGASRRGRMARVNRVAWVFANGSIPEGLHVLHRCDNTKCCNPAHLFLGTHQDNMRDMARKGRTGVIRGELNNLAKLTSAQVREIRARVAAGAVQVRIAREYGIHKQQVWNIVHRHAWRVT